MKRAKMKRPVHVVAIRDADNRVEKFRVRGSKHVAFAFVRRLAIRRVRMGTITEAQAEAAFWRLNRIVIRAAAAVRS